jgi:hypothetical protein
MKYQIRFFVWFLCVQTLSAQSPRLPWVDGELLPEDPAFDDRIARGEESSLRTARSDASNTLLVDLGNQTGVSVTSRTLSEIRRDLNYRNNSAGYDEGETSTTLYRINRKEFKAAFVKVGDTSSGETYRVWELYEVSGGKRFQPYISEFTSRYGTAGFLCSMLLPG